MPVISVIIPAFNSEKTLGRAVDSVLCQSFKNFELILVDDGSKDNTPSICDDYSERDSRVKVIHQVNQGANHSRKNGLNISQGEYVLQVDADDWLESDALECLYAKAREEDADMVICDFMEHKDGICTTSIEKPESYDSETVLKEIFEGKLKGGVWNKLYRRSLFEQYQVSFPQDIIVLEDVLVNAQLLLHPLAIAYEPRALYHYDRTANPHSITMDKNPKFNKTANGLVTHFRELLMTTKFWPIWIEKEMPWISYLCLYYDSFDGKRFKSEFHYLADKKVSGVNNLVMLALKYYRAAHCVIIFRKFFSRLLHHGN